VGMQIFPRSFEDVLRVCTIMLMHCIQVPSGHLFKVEPIDRGRVLGMGLWGEYGSWKCA
jgi:hypothetical protein